MKLDYAIVFFSPRGFGLGFRVLSTDWYKEDVTFKYSISLDLIIMNINLYILK